MGKQYIRFDILELKLSRKRQLQTRGVQFCGILLTHNFIHLWATGFTHFALFPLIWTSGFQTTVCSKYNIYYHINWTVTVYFASILSLVIQPAANHAIFSAGQTFGPLIRVMVQLVLQSTYDAAVSHTDRL